MTRRALLAALLLAAASPAAPVPKGVKQKSNAERVVGRWVIESATKGETVFNHQHGDVWVFAPAGEKSVQLAVRDKTTYSLDYSFPTPGGNHMDVACNGHPYLGVYELDGDSLTVALAASTRPDAVEKRDEVFLFTFRREVPK